MDEIIQESIKKIRQIYIDTNESEKCVALKTAISALVKQIPEKPLMYQDTNRAECPICRATVRGIKEPFGDWCSKCGQRLDWE